MNIINLSLWPLHPIWRFPESWGYPQSSSIYRFIFQWKPYILGYPPVRIQILDDIFTNNNHPALGICPCIFSGIRVDSPIKNPNKSMVMFHRFIVCWIGMFTYVSPFQETGSWKPPKRPGRPGLPWAGLPDLPKHARCQQEGAGKTCR